MLRLSPAKRNNENCPGKADHRINLSSLLQLLGHLQQP
jgi:hypothetical protein